MILKVYPPPTEKQELLNFFQKILFCNSEHLHLKGNFVSLATLYSYIFTNVFYLLKKNLYENTLRVLFNVKETLASQSHEQ